MGLDVAVLVVVVVVVAAAAAARIAAITAVAVVVAGPATEPVLFRSSSSIVSVAILVQFLHLINPRPLISFPHHPETKKP